MPDKELLVSFSLLVKVSQYMSADWMLKPLFLSTGVML